MKSTILDKDKDKKESKNILRNLRKKIEDSISRFFYLLLINEHSLQCYENIRINYYGIIFYNSINIIFRKEDYDESEHKIYEICTNERKKGLIDCENILGTEKVKIKFIQNQNLSTSSSEISITFDDFIKF